MQTSGSGGNPLRERFREQVREDVKAAALRQLASGGASALSVNAIARELGVSGPALYRYFANRDELLAELVIDAYHDLAGALGVAADRGPGRSPHDRVRSLARAWRSFALSEPHRYGLLFAPPVPGYDAHAERLVGAANRVMAVGLDVFASLDSEDKLGRPQLAASEHSANRVGTSVPENGLYAVENFPEEMLTAVGAGQVDLLRVISAWIRLHGFVGLELGGNFSSMGVDADALFHHEVEILVRDYGPERDQP